MSKHDSFYFAFEIEKDVCHPLNFLGDKITMNLLHRYLAEKESVIQEKESVIQQFHQQWAVEQEKIQKIYQSLIQEQQKNEFFLSYLKYKGLKKNFEIFAKNAKAKAK